MTNVSASITITFLHEISLQNLNNALIALVSKMAFPGARRLQIWTLIVPDVESCPDFLRDALSNEEVHMAAAFHSPKKAIHYIIAHYALRSLLGAYLKVSANAISYKNGGYGKPMLSAASIHRNLEFNMSHSGNVIMYAFSRYTPVGIDVEELTSQFAFDELANQVLTREERNELMLLAPDAQKSAFLACWTRKEAYLKANGIGLSVPMNTFAVSLLPSEQPYLKWDRDASRSQVMWSMLHLEPQMNYVAAAVLKGPLSSITHNIVRLSTSWIPSQCISNAS